MTASFAVNLHPNVSAVARELVDSNPNAGYDVHVLEAETEAKVRPAVDWFLRKFNVNLRDSVLAFRHARMFDPIVAQGLGLNAAKVQGLRCFPFFQDDIIQGLIEELPFYLAAIVHVDLNSVEEKVTWWSMQQNCNRWRAAFTMLSLVQPSSAASERMFSLLSSSFNQEQSRALEDNVETTVMLQYNRRKR